MTMQDTAWVDIGAIEDIPILGARIIKTSGGCIAVFRTAESEAYAIDDLCPHKSGPLSQGIVHGRHVTCPLHNWVISLETGKAEGADEGNVRTFPVRIVNGRIRLDLTWLSSTKAA